MKRLATIFLIFLLFSFSKDQPDCHERSMPYWANSINSRIVGENITLRKAFKEIQYTKSNIQPANGFITLRLHISKTGNLCNIETFQIDEDYKDTKFNDGKLAEELKKITKGLEKR
ncbi:hypothetical protein [Sinomicrobium sp. M5D2P17]